MEVGEIWAYRRSAKDPLAEVRVLRIGIKKPLRVKVRFEDYEAEEVEEWVPPARLRVPWADREGFLAKERRWRAVDDAPFPPSKAELDAAIWALGEFAGGDLHAYGTGSSNTVTIVANVEGLTQKSGLSQAQLESFEHSYWDDGKLVLPWGRPIFWRRALLFGTQTRSCVQSG